MSQNEFERVQIDLVDIRNAQVENNLVVGVDPQVINHKTNFEMWLIFENFAIFAI